MHSNYAPPTYDLAAVKRAITDLPRQDRARLQSWILARFDMRGYPTRSMEHLTLEHAKEE